MKISFLVSFSLDPALYYATPRHNPRSDFFLNGLKLSTRLEKKSHEVSARKNSNRLRYNKKCRGGGFRPPPALLGLKTKHRRCIKLYIFRILMTRQTIWHYFQRNRSMFQFLTHVELSRSMAAIMEMPSYMSYQKNVAYALFTLSTKSHAFNRYRKICHFQVLSCPTVYRQ